MVRVFLIVLLGQCHSTQFVLVIIYTKTSLLPCVLQGEMKINMLLTYSVY